ncbi:LOW QUALITY PROTEIN: hypothetical protein HID58_042903 [Brassica napus]|uniref:Uncharacterized protein n=1 Tax=Brassica napus TaxID=3708 RepID=A0ABQ8BGM8_BRANA|nr:LOW QUALITY PROTEIN: hypothetical protein HID58_042903 [Brassica napus]
MMLFKSYSVLLDMSLKQSVLSQFDFRVPRMSRTTKPRNASDKDVSDATLPARTPYSVERQKRDAFYQSKGDSTPRHAPTARLPRNRKGGPGAPEQVGLGYRAVQSSFLLVELRQYLLVEWLLTPVQNEEKAKKHRRSSMSGLQLLPRLLYGIRRIQQSEAAFHSFWRHPSALAASGVPQSHSSFLIYISQSPPHWRRPRHKCKEDDLILQAVRYKQRNFKQKDRNSLIGKERKTKQCQELRQFATKLSLYHLVPDAAKDESFFLLVNHGSAKRPEEQSSFSFQDQGAHKKGLVRQKSGSFANEVQNQQGFVERRECTTDFSNHFLVRNEGEIKLSSSRSSRKKILSLWPPCFKTLWLWGRSRNMTERKTKERKKNAPKCMCCTKRWWLFLVVNPEITNNERIHIALLFPSFGNHRMIHNKGGRIRTYGRPDPDLLGWMACFALVASVPKQMRCTTQRVTLSPYPSSAYAITNRG